jgi:phytanoyl-CoA dioxygenase PhyH
MHVTEKQKRRFYRDGYVLLPNVVPQDMVDAALRAINADLGKGVDPARVTTFEAQSYCPDVKPTAAITDLVMKTPVWPLAESLTAPGVLNPVEAGQIALRFPKEFDEVPSPQPHLDGMHSPHNGVPEGDIHSFTMLAVVLLSDLDRENAGNFTVWPGTHHQYEHYFREKGPEALLEGMPAIDLPEPTQVRGKAGDVVLAHYQLGHTAAPNASARVRYAVIFRMSHVAHEEHKLAAMTDIWLEWDGMRDNVAERQVNSGAPS